MGAVIIPGMPRAKRLSLAWFTTDFLACALIFVLSLLVFWFSPVHQVTDSHYSMLLSESLLKHRSFALDQFNLPRLEPKASTRDYYVMNGDIWQLELARGHIYYYFPPGSSILSLPFVAVANILGISAANSDGTYNAVNETKIQTALAAILMALVAAVFYFTSRLLLPQICSLVIVLGGTFGTQIWSTGSRGLWSHTWATLLTSLIVYFLLAAESGRRQINPITLASLLAWLYFVRPSGSVVAGAVTIFLMLFHRRLMARYAVTGAIWAGTFVAYSWVNFGKPLPSYFQASRLRFDLLPLAFAGNMVSPSRGLFVYVPALLFVIYLLIRYRKYLPLTRLVWLSLGICGFHILAVSAFANLWGDWWGGASFGPRYTTELAPWFVLLTVLGWKGRMAARDLSKPGSASRLPDERLDYTARLAATKAIRSTESHESHEITRKTFRAGSSNTKQSAQAKRFAYKTEIVVGLLLLGLSVFINARGATSLETWKWSQPSTDQQLRALLWDWRHPQFLAGLQPPAPPVEFPLVQPPTLIDVMSPKAGNYLWYGWSGAEKNLRWTDGREATVVFSLNEPRDLLLEIRMAPFLSGLKLVEQRLTLKLNERVLDTLRLADREVGPYSVRLPKSLLSSRNVLTLVLPDAASPASLGAGTDARLLGIRVESMLFELAE